MKLRVCMSCGVVFCEDFVKFDKDGDSICPVCGQAVSMGITVKEDDEVSHD